MQPLFLRSELNPVLRPEGSEWWKIYNPGAALDSEGRFHIFPRVVKKEVDWHSRIGHAVSDDGEHFTWTEKLTLVRQSANEVKGLEDPRVTCVDGTFYMTFAAYDGKNVVLHSATAKSLDGPWHRQGPMVPDFDFSRSGGRMVRWVRGKPVEGAVARGRHWSKSGALLSEKINGRYVLLFGEFRIWLATSADGAKYQVDREPVLQPRKGTTKFDNTFIEMGPPPVLTDKGWLVLYHGIDDAFRYQLGFVVLDKSDPHHILYRCERPIFGPEKEYEIGEALIDVIEGGLDVMSKLDDAQLKAFYKKARDENILPQVTFCTGAVVKEGKLWLYYGAGDTSVCTARIELRQILDLVP